MWCASAVGSLWALAEVRASVMCKRPERRAGEGTSGSRCRRAGFGASCCFAALDLRRRRSHAAAVSEVHGSLSLSLVILRVILPTKAKELARGGACPGHLQRHRSLGGDSAPSEERPNQISWQGLREVPRPARWWYHVRTLTGGSTPRNPRLGAPVPHDDMYQTPCLASRMNHECPATRQAFARTSQPG